MAKTSFSGIVRSKNGYNTYRTNSTTGVETTYGTREGGVYALGGTTGSSSVLGFAPTDVILVKVLTQIMLLTLIQVVLLL